MIDVVAEQGWLVATLKIIQLLQMILQSRWFDESAITTLPFIEKEHLYLFNNLSTIIPDLCYKTCRDYHILMKPLAKEFLEDQIVAVKILFNNTRFYKNLIIIIYLRCIKC